ncbi:MAG: hypothetical protein BK997_03865 [Candidatus Micrarchaeum sp. ARMAN-1]|jgi:hypothetical protein|nr:MAG: hypothetical protein BK997_03865 [Candidatus Micrarchaeum sp. ARMAN-1]OJT94401.1 MAG: hypothetical protein JJ59_02945 [Candidatus Micrarchaeum sp. AZ1]
MANKALLAAFFGVMLALMLYGGVAHAANAGSYCNMAVSSNGTYSIGSSCSDTAISFPAGVSQAKVYCGPGSSVRSVLFGNNTYNNTLFNCTFNNARIASMHDAQNNIISPYGSYNTSFLGNSSNLAVGYYFVFVPKGPNGNYSLGGFAAIMPDALVKFNPGVGGSQQTTYEQIVQDAQINNYILPRFGAVPPGPVLLGPQRFAVEAYSIYKNHTFSYNPYFFISPFWGWDELTFKVINITSNVNFTPTLVYPRMTENVQFPDNTSMYWNYTVVKYSNATNMTFYFWKGYQVSPEGRIMYEVHNVTNGNYNYDRGVQTPGIHETIAVLKSPEFQEHDNSTTETYGVGLAFCTEKEPAIFMPGYYTMAYKYLGMLNTFFPSNQTCNTTLTVTNSNIKINCLGGIINSTNTSIHAINANNLALENCRIYGNAIDALGSKNMSIYNSTITANNDTNVPFILNDSSLYLYNTELIGYSHNGTLAHSSSIKSYNSSFDIVTTTIDYNSTTTSSTIPKTTTTVQPGAPKVNNFEGGLYLHMLELLVIFLFTTLIIAGLYLLAISAFKTAKTKR